MSLYGLNVLGTERQVLLFGLPMLVKQRNSLTRGIENQLPGKHRFGGKMR